MPDFSRVYDYFYQFRDFLSGISASLWDYLGFRILLLVQGLLSVFSWLLAAYIARNAGRPQIALHYSVDFGIDLFDAAEKVYVIPFLGLVFIIFNIMITGVVEKFSPRQNPFLLYLMGGVSVAAGLILLAALASVFLINFR